MDYNSAEVQFVPSMKVAVDLETARKVMKLIDAIDDVDDIRPSPTSIFLLRLQLSWRLRTTKCGSWAWTPA